MVSFIAQKEQGKATRNAVGDSTAFIRHANTHKPKTTQRQSNVSGKCWACGNPSHEQKNDRTAREKKCPAWTSTCTKCNIKGHYSRNCSKCIDCNTWGHRDKKSRFCKKSSTSNCLLEDENNLFSDQLAAIHHEGKDSPIDHHIFQGRWITRPSKPHPIVMANLSPMPEEHVNFGYNSPATNLRDITAPMIADSGCQSTIIPRDTANAMGYKDKDIMPVKLSMRGAIKEDLGVEGGIILEISVQDDYGSKRSYRQLVYISRKVNKAFLCREALEQLGILQENFPNVRPEYTGNISSESKISIECDCPKRPSKMPPVPTALPPGFEGKDEETTALKEWLMQYYSSTTFNTCEHQPLPMMNCEPLQLHLNPDAKPVAVHKPAMVPIHWQEQVYNDLERDVRLGVLEKVPPNTQTTWCSRMVVTAKANGSPRRTVDLQPQNRQSVRQTHHCSTPFKLAEGIPQNTKKTVTDAWNGYHSVPIVPEDRHITTFITPWGRYRYKVAPQGFLASGDAYTQRFDAIIAEFPDKVKVVDDTCMWADSVKDAFLQTCRWLDLCGRNGITMNPTKFQFAQDTVDFGGLTVTPTNIKQAPNLLTQSQSFLNQRT